MRLFRKLQFSGFIAAALGGMVAACHSPAPVAPKTAPPLAAIAPAAVATKSAKLDDAAELKLAIQYWEGSGGLPKDPTKAAELFRQSAESGNGEAMRWMGRLARLGAGGVEKDDGDAADWFSMASEAGDAPAMRELGRMFLAGEGDLPRDEATGLGWIRKAARMGVKAAQVDLKARGLKWED